MPAYVDRSIESFLDASDADILSELHRGYTSDGFVSQYTSQTSVAPPGAALIAVSLVLMAWATIELRRGG